MVLRRQDRKRSNSVKAREYLCQLSVLETKIRQRQQQKEELRQKMLSPGRMAEDADRIRTSRTDQMADREHAYEKIRKDIDRNIEKYMSEKNRIIGQIHKLRNERYIKILYLHYVPDESGEVKSLDRIADIMTKPDGRYYSVEHIRNLHWKALKEFEKKILKQNRKVI